VKQVFLLSETTLILNYLSGQYALKAGEVAE